MRIARGARSWARLARLRHASWPLVGSRSPQKGEVVDIEAARRPVRLRLRSEAQNEQRRARAGDERES